MFSLIVDNRERSLFSYIDKEIKIFNYEKMQLNTGDYLIMFDNKMVKACIERKTYTDFAASFRDGRYKSELANMKKMRDETGCQLFFIIEGNAFPALTSKFSRVPYPCILGAINKLMLRDNVFIIQTKNEEHTAKKLNELLTTMKIIYEDELKLNKLGGAPNTKCNVAETNNKDVNPKDDNPKDDNPKDDYIIIDNIDENIKDNLSEDNTLKINLTKRHIKSDEDICMAAWSNLDGISLEFSKILISKFSIYELIMGNISIAEIGNLKTSFGRKINNSAYNSLIHIHNKSVINCALMISAIVGITKEYAKKILTVITIDDMCNKLPNELANTLIDGKKIGIKKIENIKKLLHFKLCK